MRFLGLIALLALPFIARAQTMTVITTLTNGLRDTVKFGFHEDATQGEDTQLGENNEFMMPVNGYEGRILQRDSLNFSCAENFYGDRVYYEENFDSKVNLRNPLDTSLQNRLFEIWYSDNETDSMEVICDIPLKEFIQEGLFYPFDCFGDPPSPVGLWVIYDDTFKQFKADLSPGLGIRQLILVTKPNIGLTGIAEQIPSHDVWDVIVYPNPTSESFFFKIPQHFEVESLIMYDAIGRAVQHIDNPLPENEIDVSNYSAGLYRILVELKNGSRVIKSVIKI